VVSTPVCVVNCKWRSDQKKILGCFLTKIVFHSTLWDGVFPLFEDSFSKGSAPPFLLTNLLSQNIKLGTGIKIQRFGTQKKRRKKRVCVRGERTTRKIHLSVSDNTNCKFYITIPPLLSRGGGKPNYCGRN